MGHTHRVKYEGHRKFVSGAAAAEELGVSGTTFSYLKHRGKLSGVEVHKIGDCDYYGLNTIRAFKKDYKPRMRRLEGAGEVKHRVRRTNAQIAADEAVKLVVKPPEKVEVVKTQEIQELITLVRSLEAQVKHLYAIWK